MGTDNSNCGIYIHIPYCVPAKCAYCDFLSLPLQNPAPYVNALLSEINSANITSQIDTVYIGGGTPTALPSLLLCKILAAVKNLPLSPEVEVTIEANPGTLTPQYLQDLRAHGANRLSLGLQTTKPHLLNEIGRKHTKSDFLQNYQAARRAGFDNINVDLMFALPGQTLDDWRETLEEIIALTPNHISAYSLTPAENTPLWDALESGKTILPSDEADREMYHYARNALSNAGYNHYELSNFAKPGFESRHNINCWKRVPYFGYGLGAHSFDGKSRWHNTEDMSEYLSMPPFKLDFQLLTESEAQSESIILGLRLLNGIAESTVPSRYVNELQSLIKNGLLTRRDKNIILTPKGMDLANQVFTAFM